MEYNDNVISVSSGRFPYTQGLGETIYKEMLAAPSDAVIQVDDTTGEADTYRDLLRRCIRTAKALQARKVAPNDAVLVHSHNHINTVVPVIASYFIGALPSCVDFNLSLADTLEFLKKIQPRIIFSHSAGVSKLQKVAMELGGDVVIVDFAHFDAFISNFNPDSFQPKIVRDLDEPAGIFFTSGTTGFPKKLYLSHKMILSTSIHFWGLSTIPKVIIICPDSFWISYTETLLFVILQRGTRVIVPRLAMGNLSAVVQKYQISVMLLAPSLVQQLLTSPLPCNTSLVFLFVCGATCSYSVMSKLRNLLPTTSVLPLYGQTEFGGVTLGWNIARLDDIKLAYERPTACGRPNVGFSYKVVHPKTGENLGPGTVGEVRFRSVFQSNKSKSASEWDEWGFFKTGDLGYYDDDFCFYITDRIKEVFYYKMVSIFPSKLEPILKSHPAVKDAIIIGVPHDLDTNHPMALVELDDSHNRTTENDIRRYFNSKVEDGEQLRGGVRFVNKIPVTATGKLNRAQAKRLVLNQI